MSAAMKKGLMFFLVLFCSIGLAFAGNGHGDKNGDQDHDRLQDGSCIFGAMDGDASVLPLIAKGKGQSKGQGKGGGQQDRLRDGSCLDNVQTGSASDLTLAANGKGGSGKGKGDRQRDRDGSCL